MIDGSNGSQQHPAQTLDAGRRIEAAILAVATVLIRHWLLTANIALIIFAALPWAAPVLMSTGYTQPASVIYRFYRLTCHQKPHRSYFVGGLRLTYNQEEFEGMTGTYPPADYVGAPGVGYKVAYCQRDLATYAAMLLGGLVFAIARRRLPRLPIWLYAVLVLPLAVDGLTQLMGWRESTWLWRTLTGGLFGLATVWLLYPELDAVMQQAEQSFSARLRELRPDRSVRPARSR